MAYVKLKTQTGVVKELKLGFSWTTFWFGGWVSIFRGEWSEVAKWVFLNPITLGFWGLAQCWNANKKTIISHLEKGYEPSTDLDRALLQNKNIIG
ncbi:hypothetical protein COJ96_10815 [Bacillus sp. AFS073361]|uniref:hypothetical protein n=1 Tax=Bacillus sp. AFS073361 TaxID=2033511 RepID=UPI000BF90DCA|nr:hypothetical protein [Bacillus sp. AFS073361]PFP29387.1 hypothetical protein COJ96_10815 [Bacillus sp. AFS073361]